MKTEKLTFQQYTSTSKNIDKYYKQNLHDYNLYLQNYFVISLMITVNLLHNKK